MRAHDRAALSVAELAGALLPGGRCALPAAAAHHAATSCGFARGDALTLFTAPAASSRATIERIDRREVIVRVDAFVAVERESPLAVTLVQAVAASDAMDYAIRKAVELGVAAMQPVITARSAPLRGRERGAQKRARWRNVAIAACEQSGRNRVPAVGAAVPFAQWLAARAHARRESCSRRTARCRWPRLRAPADADRRRRRSGRRLHAPTRSRAARARGTRRRAARSARAAHRDRRAGCAGGDPDALGRLPMMPQGPRVRRCSLLALAGCATVTPPARRIARTTRTSCWARRARRRARDHVRRGLSGARRRRRRACR